MPPMPPQVNLVIDREKANTFGVTFADINSTISTNLGSTYVNDFPNRGRMQRVIGSGRSAASRMQAADILNLQRQEQPRAAWCRSRPSRRIEWVKAPTQIVGFNGYPSVRISGEAKPGFSSGDAIAEMERLAAQAAARLRLRVDRAVAAGNPVGLAGAVPARRCRRCWCSCAWPRSMKAGPFPSRCC
jgi:multidrug efflux pump